MTRAPEIPQAELDGLDRIDAISHWYVENHHDAYKYHQALNAAIWEVRQSGSNSSKRFFYATQLVRIFCAEKRHGVKASPLARVYATSEGPLLFASISNDLRDRRAPREVILPGTAAVVCPRDPWFASRVNHDRGGKQMPDHRGAALLSWPNLDQFLSGEGDYELTEPREGVLLCGTCGRRTLPSMVDLLAAAESAEKAGTVGRVAV